MTQPITNTVSTFIDSQLPDFIREENPQFGAFLKAYYEWMENSANSAITTQSKSLLSYIDIDRTTDNFIQYYINDFLPYFPNDVVLDERKLIKAARNFYQKKGSVESIQFLFRVLYGKEAEIYFPKDYILKTSDGKWTLPQSLRLLVDSNNLNFDINLLVGRQGLGSITNAACIIESATRTVDQGLGIELIELYVSNINKSFGDLENLNVVYGQDANGNSLVFSEKIIASISNILINPNYRGLRYKGYIEDGLGNIIYPGDPIVISGGLEPGDPQAQKAVAFVGNVTSGSISGITVNYGGSGYRISPNTIVKIINNPSDNTGTGANIIVQSIDTTNAIYVNVNTDSIDYEANVVLNAASYSFSNDANANANTLLSDAFTYQNLQFGAITSMNVINGGGAYTAVPSLNLAVTYYSDLLTDLVTIGASQNTINSDMQFMDDLGLMCNVVINSGGSGYDPTKDEIIVPDSVGYNAAFSFVVNGGGAITGVTIVNRGEGYISLPINLVVANSTNNQNSSAGSGASLTAFGFGQGANISLSVNQIGEIIDFRITNRGFDYISSPNISLKVADLIINPFSNLESFAVDTQVFQGSSINNATWRANVDSYNITSSLLRVYNYQGALNVYSNISAATFNVTINTVATGNVTIYGNGLAKANAIFLNGLIKYPGFYLTTDGFLSSDQYLQDAVKYHNFSYVIVVEKALTEYKNALMKLVHPIGTSMLGTYSVIEDEINYVTPNTEVDIVPVVSGSLNTNSNSSIIYGVGTNFGTTGNVGDIIIFNTSDTSRREQAKIITNVSNVNAITVESNTMFFHYTLGSTAASSNVVSAVNVYGNIAVGDLIAVDVNNNSNIVFSNVLAVSQNSITGNTVFGAAYSNLTIFVFPSINSASYSIVKMST